jgi:hypothetical protein
MAKENEKIFVGYHSVDHFHTGYSMEELLVLQPQTYNWLGEYV